MRISASQIAEQADLLRASRAFGESDLLYRLFDFLMEAPDSERRPKEIEIALRVLNRGASFDGTQDSAVRVGIHRLRRKLDDFYAGEGRHQPIRLRVPKGQYRIAAEPLSDARPTQGRPWRRWAIAGAAGVAALNLAIWGAFMATHSDGRLGQVRRQAPWAQLAKSHRPLIVVVGDYYIFGETDEAAGVDRLVREYSINSRDDLDRYLMDNPKAEGRYRDMDLYYLPVGAALALRYVMPVLAPVAGGSDRVRVVLASDVTPEMLKQDDIVYVGYLSGLGVLRDAVFGGSRFAVGDTYDELIDARTGRHYVSQEGGPERAASSERDYGYFSTFRGPQGNRIVIVAGMRDSALMEMAEAATGRAALAQMAKAAGRAEAFEGLYEVDGIRRTNVRGRLLVGSPLAADRIWTPHPGLVFPPG